MVKEKKKKAAAAAKKLPAPSVAPLRRSSRRLAGEEAELAPPVPTKRQKQQQSVAAAEAKPSSPYAAAATEPVNEGQEEAAPTTMPSQMMQFGEDGGGKLVTKERQQQRKHRAGKTMAQNGYYHPNMVDVQAWSDLEPGNFFHDLARLNLPTNKDLDFPEGYQGRKPTLRGTHGTMVDRLANLLNFAMVTGGGVPTMGCTLTSLCNDEEIPLSYADFENSWNLNILPHLSFFEANDQTKISLRNEIGRTRKHLETNRKHGTWLTASEYVHCLNKQTLQSGTPMYKPYDDLMKLMGYDMESFFKSLG
jgi:hypothetical protein